MSVIKEEFLSIKISRLLRDGDPFPTTTVMINNTMITAIEEYSRDLALILLGAEDLNDVTVTSTTST